MTCQKRYIGELDMSKQTSQSVDMPKLRNRNSDLSQLVRRARESLGMSREKLAHDVGVSTSTITRFENTGTLPRVDTIMSISRALDVDLIEALRGAKS